MSDHSFVKEFVMVVGNIKAGLDRFPAIKIKKALFTSTISSWINYNSNWMSHRVHTMFDSHEAL